MINNIKIFIFVLLLFFLSTFPSLAASNYVLPYPSSMPGGTIYKIHLVYEKLMKYWYFGNYGQFFYNLKQSDKYLVESKTLFEYNQYLLAYDSLNKSNQYFVNTLPFLTNAKKEGKNISENREILRQASQKHIETLLKLKKDIPQSFMWVPEKDKPTNLKLWDAVDKSIEIRKKYL